MFVQTLSQTNLYWGYVNFPKGVLFDETNLLKDVVYSILKKQKLKRSRELDAIEKYIMEHLHAIFKLNLETSINGVHSLMFKPKEISKPTIEADPMDYKNAPDFVCLYGFKVNKCKLIFHYEDGSRYKGRSLTCDFEPNKFFMFPSTAMYYIENNQEEDSNLLIKSCYAVR